MDHQRRRHPLMLPLLRSALPPSLNRRSDPKGNILHINHSHLRWAVPIRTSGRSKTARTGVCRAASLDRWPTATTDAEWLRRQRGRGCRQRGRAAGGRRAGVHVHT